jgi:zinc D-Ala-D-Ala carboxypeptidase
MKKIFTIVFLTLLLTFSLAACNDNKQIVESDFDQQSSSSKSAQTNDDKSKVEKSRLDDSTNEVQSNASKEDKQKQAEQRHQPVQSSQTEDGIAVVAQPASIPVLVNKYFKLPDSYTPQDLVTTSVPFISSATAEKRQLRSEAAAALAEMFAGANAQGVSLLGVSGYRSHATQVSLFNYYVQQDGYEKARTYSALPGTSEHETGLSIDVTGGDGRCPAQDCFGGTIEAQWLQDHVAEYGFIIRYPNGKDSITGYKYEPWHIRYVGKAIAAEIMSRGITMEEYFNAIPVNN